MEAIIQWVDEARSTNSLLAAEADKLPHGAIIAAHTQTAGRGQRGNSWEAEPGKNLTFSMLLRPRTLVASRQFELSMIVALAVCDMLHAASGLDFVVKWPNDIYYKDLKICGILIENSITGSELTSIAGIGININQQRFLSDAPNPVSLAMLTGREYDLDELLADVGRRILDRLEAYEASDDCDMLLNEFCSRMWRRSGMHRWLDAASATEFDAEIISLAPNGLLTLRDSDDNLRTYAFKEVAAVL